MKRNLLFTLAFVAILGAGAFSTMQDPPRPVPVDWVTVEFERAECQEGDPRVTWQTEYSSGVGGYVVSGVTLSDVTPDCRMNDIYVYLNADGRSDATGGTVLAWAKLPGKPSVTAGDSIAVFDFSDAHVSARLINGIAAAIPDEPTAWYSLSRYTADWGDEVVFRARLTSKAGSSGPTGRVLFVEGTAEVASCELTAGSACEVAVRSLGAGVHRIAASYVGDNNYKAKSAPAQEVVVYRSRAAVAFTPSLTTMLYGTRLGLTARVELTTGLAAPTGAVTFRYATGTGSIVQVASCPLAQVAPLVAECSTGTTVLLPNASAYQIYANYPGTLDILGGASATSSVRVTGPSQTTTTLRASTLTPRYGQSVTLTVRVARDGGGASPVGRVAISDGTRTLTVCTLYSVTTGVSGCTYTTSGLDAGAHALRATYMNDLFGASVDETTATVLAADTTTNVTVSTTAPVLGQRYTVTARTSVILPGRGTPTGRIAFFVDDPSMSGTPAKLCAAGLSCIFDVTTASDGSWPQAVGAHRIDARFVPDEVSAARFNPSANAVVRSVGRARTSVTWVGDTTTDTYGNSFRITATVTVTSPGSGKAYGRLDFSEGTRYRGSCDLTSGGIVGTNKVSCSITWTPAGAGTRSLAVYYRGSSSYVGSSGSRSVSVTRRASTTSVALFTALPKTRGGYVTFYGIVSATYGRPTGSVSFRHGGVALGSSALRDPADYSWCRAYLGDAEDGHTSCVQYTIRYQYVGEYYVSAAYLGSTNFKPSTSGSIHIRVTSLTISRVL